MVATDPGLWFKTLINTDSICRFFTSIVLIFYFKRSHYRIFFRPLNMLDPPCLQLDSFPAISHWESGFAISVIQKL